MTAKEFVELVASLTTDSECPECRKDPNKRNRKCPDHGLNESHYTDGCVDTMQTLIKHARSIIANGELDAPVKVYTASIRHRHGLDQFAALSEDAIYARLAEFAREWWDHEIHDADIEEPEADRDVVQAYFENVLDEEYDVSSFELGKLRGSREVAP